MNNSSESQKEFFKALREENKILVRSFINRMTQSINGFMDRLTQGMNDYLKKQEENNNKFMTDLSNNFKVQIKKNK